MGVRSGAMPRRKKKPGQNYSKEVAEDLYYLHDPPLLVRDPTPRKGLLEFLDIRDMTALQSVHGDDAKQSYIQMVIEAEQSSTALEKYRWVELFVVCAHGMISLYRPERMVTGFTSADALASIPVDEVKVAGSDARLGILDLCTPARVYRFRSQQLGEVSKWSQDIMKSTTL